MTKTDLTRFDFVILAKGFAILCVVLGHFTPAYMPPFFHQLKEAVYLFHMPLFMLLAGFLYRNSLEKRQGGFIFSAFIKKKALRLLVPYFFLSFSIAALNGLLQRFVAVKQSVTASYLLRLCYEDVGGSATFLWFLYTLFLLFLVVGGVHTCTDRWSRLSGDAVSRWVLFPLSVILLSLPLPDVLYLNAVGRYMFYFMVGVLLFRPYRDRGSFSGRAALVSAIVCVVTYVGRFYLTPGAASVLLSTLCGLSACNGILWLSCRLSVNVRKHRAVRACFLAGKYSSYIYLLHMAGVYIVRLSFERIGLFSSVFLPSCPDRGHYRGPCLSGYCG
ncbi:MAG: acyltransferase [Paraprevotella sp.]|nr:acyltransferase [Paraprevotella sp.]